MKHISSRIRLYKVAPGLCRLALGLCAALTAGFTLPAQATAPEWISQFGGPGYDTPSQVVTDSVGNVIVLGTSNRHLTNDDFRVLKYDPSGSLLWTRRYNGTKDFIDEGVAVDVDGADNIYVTGTSASSTTKNDYVTLKYSPDGTELWRARFDGGDTSDSPVALKVSRAGDVYVTGQIVKGGLDTVYTLRYDTNGNKVWGRRFDADYNHSDPPAAANLVTGLALDQDGDAYITGEARFYEPGYGDFNFVAETTKYLPDGTRAWTRRYADPEDGEVFSEGIATDPDGNVIIGTTVERGYSEFNAGNFMIFKYSPDGKQIWSSEPQFAGNDSTLQALSVDSGGNIVATGYSGFNNGGPDGPFYYYAVTKLDPDGAQVWAKTSTTIYNRRVYLALDAGGDAFLSGTSAPNEDLSEDFTVTEKYAASDGSLVWSDTQDVAGQGETESKGVAVDNSGAAIVIATIPDAYRNYNIATFKYAP